jgi:ADP-ribose pyrophosphatase YjhB (NUDIX family)
VVVEAGGLLLVRRSSPPDAGLWSVPATQVALDEPLVAAVVRAVDESAGLEAVCEGLLGHLEHLSGDAHRVLLAFEATVLSDGGMAPAASWVDLDDVAERPLIDGLPELLADRGILRLIA